MNSHPVDIPVIDEVDHLILGVLRREGRLSWRDLGERIGLGASATAERVRRLEATGIITGYRAELDLSRLGIGLQAITEIRMARGADHTTFEGLLASTPEVQAAMHVTGAHDYVVMLACAGVPRLDELLTRWRTDAGVEESSTRIVLNRLDLTARRDVLTR